MNSTKQSLYKRAKTVIKKNTGIGFYNGKEQRYIETDASGVALGPTLLLVKDGM